MKKILFVHIPKTGGISVERVLGRAAGLRACPAYDMEAFFALPSLDYDVFQGHLMYFAKEFIQPDFTFTVLRDPIERSVSAFEHIARDSGHPAHRFFLEAPDLAAALGDSNLRMHISNAMTRFLGLRPAFEDYAMPVQAYGAALRDCPDEQLLEDAKAAIGELDFLGFTETIDAHQQQLIGLLSVHDATAFEPVQENRNPNKTTKTYREALPPHVLEALREANAEDLELYSFARALAARKGWFAGSSTSSRRDDPAHAAAGDRPAVSVLEQRLCDPFEGAGWHALERRSDRFWRFTGPGETASIYLPRLTGEATELTIEAVHAVTPAHFAELQVRFNGVALGAGRYDGMRVTFTLPANVAPAACTHIELITPPAQQPESGDDRMLGVAISRIEIR